MCSKLLQIPLNITSHVQKNVQRYTAGFLIFGIGVHVIDYFFEKFLSKWIYTSEPEEPWYDCIFLTDKGLRGEESTTADKLTPVTKPIVDFIDGAQKTLDICFYVITANNVVEAILIAKKRKVVVRVIVDYNTGLLNNEFTRKFLKAGIPVYAKQTNQNASIMHHKFCIRDKSILLQASMNLTQNTAKGSFDNIFMTNDMLLVGPFQELFEDLREKFTRD